MCSAGKKRGHMSRNLWPRKLLRKFVKFVSLFHPKKVDYLSMTFCLCDNKCAIMSAIESFNVIGSPFANEALERRVSTQRNKPSSELSCQCGIHNICFLLLLFVGACKLSHARHWTWYIYCIHRCRQSPSKFLLFITPVLWRVFDLSVYSPDAWMIFQPR